MTTGTQHQHGHPTSSPSSKHPQFLSNRQLELPTVPATATGGGWTEQAR